MPVKHEVAMLLGVTLQQCFPEAMAGMVASLPDSREEGTISAEIKGTRYQWLWCLGEAPTPLFLSVAAEKLKPANHKAGDGIPVAFESFRLTNYNLSDIEIDVCVTLIEPKDSSVPMKWIQK